MHAFCQYLYFNDMRHRVLCLPSPSTFSSSRVYMQEAGGKKENGQKGKRERNSKGDRIDG